MPPLTPFIPPSVTETFGDQKTSRNSARGPLRVLCVAPAFYPADVYGGSIWMQYHLCRHLAQLGLNVRVLTTNARGHRQILAVDTTREISLGERFVVRYCPRWFGDSVSPRLLLLLPAQIVWADVVHLVAVYSLPTLPTLFFTTILRKPVVWYPGGSLQRWEGSTRTALKTVWEWTCRLLLPARLVLHTTSMEEAAASRRRLPGARAVVIPLGVDIPDQVPRVEERGVLRLLYLGRLHPVKGLERLLDACARVQATARIPWNLTIAGTGDAHYTSVLRASIERLGLARHVRLVGLVVGEKKRELFARSDVLIMPSFVESFGLSIVEALAHGVPVIASRGTPWQGLLKRGCGLWVDNDPQSLAEAILRIRDLPRNTMGARGRQWVMAEFSAARMAQKIAALYEQLVHTPRQHHADDYRRKISPDAFTNSAHSSFTE